MFGKWQKQVFTKWKRDEVYDPCDVIAENRRVQDPSDQRECYDHDEEQGRRARCEPGD